MISNILKLKPFVFNSASKVSLNIVESFNISKIVILIIRLVFGRIQALKNLINYQFIAWLSAYKDVLSNIFKLKPVIFEIFSKVGLNIVKNVKLLNVHYYLFALFSAEFNNKKSNQPPIYSLVISV